MKRLVGAMLLAMGAFAIVAATVALSGCVNSSRLPLGEQRAPTLTIRWQRLVDGGGETCGRCGSTERELQEALAKLKKTLGTLGIRVVLEKRALSTPLRRKGGKKSSSFGRLLRLST